MEGQGKPTPAAISNPVPTPSAATLTIDPKSLKSLIVSSLFAAGISWLPYEEDADGDRVPAVIFKGQVDAFQYFVTLIVFGFSASLSALYSYNRPGLARFLRSCSVFFLFCAIGVLLFAVCKGFMF